MNLEEFVEPLVSLARKAGDAILEVYATDFDVQEKFDDSPLTKADLASHRIIIAGLRGLAPEIPIISEESGLPDFEERRRWGRYWLIDPLDGTSSKVVFASALRLARNRDLTDPGAPDLAARRKAFATELREVTRRIEGVEALVRARHAGVKL